MADKRLPDQIADFFIALIFVENLKAGDKLPPERQLAELLQVDRTSLRTALKILTRMNLLESIQGSGITILDMRSHAGIDMLDNVLRIPEIELGSDLTIQLVQGFTQVLPLMFMELFKTNSNADLNNIITTFKSQADQCKAGASAEALASFDIALQDSCARLLDQPLLLMTANSSRRTRLRLMTMLYEHIDLNDHFARQLTMVQQTADGKLTFEELELQYRQHIHKLGVDLINYLRSMPKKSCLLKSPLRHLPDLLTIPQQK